MPSSSPAQARLMAAIAHGWHKPGGGGPSVKVAKEFNQADKGRGKIHMRKGGMKPKMPRLPPALATQPVPNAMSGPAAGPASPPPPSGMGMKKGGVVPKTDKVPKDETKEKKWKLKGEAKDKKGEKIAMKSGGSVKFKSGGTVNRGDGIAERGHTRGTFR